MKTITERTPEDFPEGDLIQEELEALISTLQQEEKLQSIDSTVEYLEWKRKCVIASKYTVNIVEKIGGEGEGEEYYIIFRLTNLDNKVKGYFKFYGSYSSWDGVDWNTTPIVVRPVCVHTVRFYQ